MTFFLFRKKKDKKSKKSKKGKKKDEDKVRRITSRLSPCQTCTHMCLSIQLALYCSLRFVSKPPENAAGLSNNDVAN